MPGYIAGNPYAQNLLRVLQQTQYVSVLEKKCGTVTLSLPLSQQKFHPLQLLGLQPSQAIGPHWLQLIPAGAEQHQALYSGNAPIAAILKQPFELLQLHTKVTS
jgi:hypothetical protein